MKNFGSALMLCLLLPACADGGNALKRGDEQVTSQERVYPTASNADLGLAPEKFVEGLNGIIVFSFSAAECQVQKKSYADCGAYTASAAAQKMYDPIKAKCDLMHGTTMGPRQRAFLEIQQVTPEWEVVCYMPNRADSWGALLRHKSLNTRHYVNKQALIFETIISARASYVSYAEQQAYETALAEQELRLLQRNQEKLKNREEFRRNIKVGDSARVAFSIQRGLIVEIKQPLVLLQFPSSTEIGASTMRWVRIDELFE